MAVKEQRRRYRSTKKARSNPSPVTRCSLQPCPNASLYVRDSEYEGADRGAPPWRFKGFNPSVTRCGDGGLVESWTRGCSD